MNIDEQAVWAQNPWWIKEELIQQDEKILEYQTQRYRYIPAFLLQYPFDRDAILTLRGPRQIGKSTAIKLLIRKLLMEKQVPKETVFYFACDRVEDFNELFEIIHNYQEETRSRFPHERLFIFLDEVSFVREWPRAIKSLADRGQFRNVIITITGSNILDLFSGSERMPGRRGKLSKLDFELLPLSFGEFVAVVSPKMASVPKKERIIHQSSFNQLLSDYLLTGGFPISINEFYDKGFIPSYVYKLYTSWIEGDLERRGHSARLLYQMTQQILSTFTTPTSWLKLGKEAGGMAHNTVFDYVDTLQKMHVMSICEWMDVSRKTVLFRKNRKLYFLDPFIFHCFLGKKLDIDDSPFHALQAFLRNPEGKAKLIENIVGEQLRRRYKNIFFTGGKHFEIDFVVKDHENLKFFEVKHQKSIDFAALQKTYSSLNTRSSLMVITSKTTMKKNRIACMPASLFLLQIEPSNNRF